MVSRMLRWRSRRGSARSGRIRAASNAAVGGIPVASRESLTSFLFGVSCCCAPAGRWLRHQRVSPIECVYGRLCSILRVGVIKQKREQTVREIFNVFLFQRMNSAVIRVSPHNSHYIWSIYVPYLNDSINKWMTICSCLEILQKKQCQFWLTFQYPPIAIAGIKQTSEITNS